MKTPVVVTLLIGAGWCVSCGDVTSTLIIPTGAASSTSAAEPSSATPPMPDAGPLTCAEHEDCVSNGDDVICHPTWRSCVECTQDGHCHDVGESCSSVLGECAIPCQNAEDCDDDDPICDQTLGFCVDCQVDGDCPASHLCRRSNCVGPDGRDD